eukprot:c22919_g1_i2 orf=495-2210(-)
MELEAAGKNLVRRLSAAAQRLDEGGGEPADDMESLLAEAKAHLDPSTPTGQGLLDMIGIDMPSILVKFSVIPHGSCGGIAESILETLLESCDPRDLFTAYMEALHLYSMPETLALCPIILDGLPKVFTRLRRRRVEYFKESLPGLLRIAGLAMDTSLETRTILDKLVHIVKNLLDISLREEVKEQSQRLHETLGVFILLLLAKFSEFDQLNGSSAVQSLLMQLAKLIPACGLPYLDMITGSFSENFVDSMTEYLAIEDGYILHTRQGAALAVWWMFCFGEAAIDNQEAVKSVVDGVRSSRHAFVSALSNVLVLLSSKEKSWKKVEMGIDLLTVILEWGTTPSADNPLYIQLEFLEDKEFLNLKELLQVVQNVVIFFPQSRTRQRAYSVLVNIIRKVLPPEERFEALKQLITECEHSSMVSLLIYVVKEEVDKAIPSRSAIKETMQSLNSPFKSERVLELIDFVLRPPVGGPPDLPNQIDAVLAVLNLYRFVLIKETTGKSNYTGVLFIARLQEACLKWLQPLRAVLEGFKRNFSDDNSEVSANILLSISNLEGVLYRCLELAEAALKEHSS